MTPRARGDTPGLLRPGSPVIVPDWRGNDRPPVSAVYAYTWVGKAAGGFAFHHYIEPWTDGTPRDRTVGFQVAHRDVELDLTDRTGMNHAAEWVAVKVGLTLGPTAPGWGLAGWGIWDLRNADGAHAGFHFNADTARKFSDPKRGIVHHVPDLCGVTDACEAMAIVVEHLAKEDA